MRPLESLASALRRGRFRSALSSRLDLSSCRVTARLRDGDPDCRGRGRQDIRTADRSGRSEGIAQTIDVVATNPVVRGDGMLSPIETIGSREMEQFAPSGGLQARFVYSPASSKCRAASASRAAGRRRPACSSDRAASSTRRRVSTRCRCPTMRSTRWTSCPTRTPSSTAVFRRFLW